MKTKKNPKVDLKKQQSILCNRSIINFIFLPASHRMEDLQKNLRL